LTDSPETSARERRKKIEKKRKATPWKKKYYGHHLLRYRNNPLGEMEKKKKETLRSTCLKKGEDREKKEKRPMAVSPKKQGTWL